MPPGLAIALPGQEAQRKQDKACKKGLGKGKSEGPPKGPPKGKGKRCAEPDPSPEEEDQLPPEDTGPFPESWMLGELDLPGE